MYTFAAINIRPNGKKIYIWGTNKCSKEPTSLFFLTWFHEQLLLISTRERNEYREYKHTFLLKNILKMVKSRDLLPSLAMVLVQIGYAGMNITSKMAMESGMKPLILVAYRQIFATIATFPVAFFLERYVLSIYTYDLVC